MIFVYVLSRIDRVMNAAVHRLGLESRLGAWVAYWSGRVIFRQILYVQRIEKMSGWTQVQAVGPPRVPYTLSVNGAVKHGYLGDSSVPEYTEDDSDLLVDDEGPES